MAKVGKNNQNQNDNGKAIDPDDIEMVDTEAHDDPSNDNDANAEMSDEQAELFGIPNYLTTDDETRAIMDEHIAGIDPYDLQSIIHLGREEMQRLANVAREVTDKYADDSNPILESLNDAEVSLGSLDLSGLTSKVAGYGKRGIGWAFKNPGTAVVTGVGTLLAGPAALAIPGAKAAYDYAQKRSKGPDLSDALRASVQKTDETVIQIMKALEDIPNAIEDLDALGRSRIESYRQVSIIIGAGREVIRRIDEEMIPALEKKLEKNPSDFDSQDSLERLNMGREALASHVVSMMGSRAVSQSTAVGLMQLRRVFFSAATKLGNHLHTSVPQWEAQRAEAGIALFADKVAKTSDEADKRGTEMLQLSARLNKETGEMMRKSMSKGSYDTGKVIAVLEAQTAELRNNIKAISSQRGDMDKAMLQLSKASEKFSDNMTRFQEQAGGRVLLPNMGRNEEDQALSITDQSKEDTKPGRKAPQPKP